MALGRPCGRPHAIQWGNPLQTGSCSAVRPGATRVEHVLHSGGDERSIPNGGPEAPARCPVFLCAKEHIRAILTQDIYPRMTACRTTSRTTAVLYSRDRLHREDRFVQRLMPLLWLWAFVWALGPPRGIFEWAATTLQPTLPESLVC